MAAAVAVLVIVVVAFAATRGGADSKTSVANGKPVRGGTLQFALLDAQNSPDPQLGTNYAESIIANNIGDKLVWQDPKTGKITPWLATSWKFNHDLTQLTFHLRRDVTFSDGTKFTSASVKANLDQFIRGDAKLGILPNGASLFPGYLGTDTPDEYTAVLKFKQPLASALQAASITSNGQPVFLAASTLKLSATQRAADATKIIGTGPFVYESWKPQVNTVLKRREGYNWAPPAIGHKGEAYLDKVVFNTIPEASVRTGSLTSGSIDATLDVGTTDEQPLRAQGFQIITRPVSGTPLRIDLNSSLFPTNDIAVRKAFQLGWNRDTIKKTVLSSSYAIATSILEPSVAGYVDHSSTLTYNPDEAKKLLDDDGWKPGPDGIRVKDGKKLTIKVLGVNNLVANKPAFESIQADLLKIGINLQANVVPHQDFMALWVNARTAWNGTAGNTSRDDPVVLNATYSPLLGNQGWLDPKSADGKKAIEVLGKLDTTLDPAARVKYAAAAQDLLVDQLALTNPVYDATQVIAQAPYVHGIIFDAQSRNEFVDAWKSNGK